MHRAPGKPVAPHRRAPALEAETASWDPRKPDEAGRPTGNPRGPSFSAEGVAHTGSYTGRLPCCGATTGVLKYGGGGHPMEPGKRPRPGTERTEGGNISTQRDSRRKRKRLPAYWPPLTWPPGHYSQGSTPKWRARWCRAFLTHWKVNLKVGTTTPTAHRMWHPLFRSV